MKKIIEMIGFMLKVTFLGFGGGNAMNGIIKREAVENKKWITEDEFDKLVITTNLIPGPSVVEFLSFISMKQLGKVTGALVSFFAILPHLVFALGVYLLMDTFLPMKYILIINVAVMPVIVAALISFSIKYFKDSKKNLGIGVTLSLAFATMSFCLFVPSPYNIAAFVMIFVLLMVIIVGLIKAKREVK